MRFRVGADEAGLEVELVEQLEAAERYGRLQFEITSGYRVGDGRCHGVGRAVDIACGDSVDRFNIVRSLIFVGFERIGVYTHHVHVDMCEVDHARRVLWLGGASR